MRHRMLALLLGIGLAGCGGVDPVTDRQVEAELQDRLGDWVQAWNSVTAATLEPFYIHKDQLTVVWPNGHRTRGWAEEAEFQRNFLPTVRAMNLAPQNPVLVLVRRDLALVSFGFTLDLFAGDTRQIGPGQGLMLWQKEEGAWKIYAAQLSYTKAVEAQLGTPPRRSGTSR